MKENHHGPLPAPPPWHPHSQTAKALEVYHFSSSHIDLGLIRASLEVKLACARMNHRLGFLSKEQFDALDKAIRAFLDADDGALRPWFMLDALQGGAGTASNMNVNEAVSVLAGLLSPNIREPIGALSQVNLHSSTNDVMPTALRIVLLRRFSSLEETLAQAQTAAQKAEEDWASVLVPGHTQLQEAIPLPLGRIAATWAGGLGRDRWRTFKARERLKDVNLGGTAIGTGAGAPRSFTLAVVDELRQVTGLALSRAEDCVEATSNYDGVVEAMGAIEALGVNLKRIATDIRLLGSSPSSGFGLLQLPALVKGSSIMPGKINPVIAEGIWQNAMKILANQHLLAQVAASSELQLNAFFPLLAQTALESMDLAERAVEALGAFIPQLEPNRHQAANKLSQGQNAVLALSPLFGYEQTEHLVHEARAAHCGLETHVENLNIFEPEDLAWLFSKGNLQSFGYDEERYHSLAQKYNEKIASWIRTRP